MDTEIFKCDRIIDGEQCPYVTPRPENFKRHIKEHHLKIRRLCNKCGKEMTQSSLSRHKKTDCLSTKPKSNARKPKSNARKPKSNAPTIASPTIPEPAEIKYINEYNMQTTIQIATLADGSKMVIPSRVKIEIENCAISMDISSDANSPAVPLTLNDPFLTPVGSPTNG